MNYFSCNTRIVAGAGALQALQEQGSKRLLVVTDPFFAKNGMAERVARQANAESYEIFDGVKPDPTVELAAEGTARVKAFLPDHIVALGGGSAIDCAKAMAYFSGAGLVSKKSASISGRHFFCISKASPCFPSAKRE